MQEGTIEMRRERFEAKDAAAETFAIGWRRLDREPEGDGTLPWLLATARDVLANRSRTWVKDRRAEAG
jgi:DNA-directed RNA polymerase specialized sigma24 family protein